VSESLGGLPQFEGITAGTVSTWSLFRSAELNGRTWGGGSITWLAGFRWVERTDASLIDLDGVVEPIGSVRATDDTVSFMGEVGVNASVSITRWLAWRAGYSVFWLSGVATAAQQFAATDLVENTGSVNTNGSVLLHGVTTGLEARW